MTMSVKKTKRRTNGNCVSNMSKRSPPPPSNRFDLVFDLNLVFLLSKICSLSLGTHKYIIFQCSRLTTANVAHLQTTATMKMI